MVPKTVAGCPLCEKQGGLPIWHGPRFRVVRVEDTEGFPAFYRVVWQDHATEFSDLPPADRVLCMEAVAQVERVLRAQLRPDKINLAAFGNVVPHLHWHVTARFESDSHFPAPSWAQPLRPRDTVHEAALVRRLPAVDAAMFARLSSAFPADGAGA